VLKRERPRPTLNSRDHLFWTTLRRCWSRWSDVLVIVKPETVIGWHRTGFRLYWRWRSRPEGRPTKDQRGDSHTHPAAGGPGKRWLTFLHNHRDVIVAFDFFTVPTVTFQFLYCFFVIEHGRRKILHFKCDPTSDGRMGHPTTA
jgi:putative transposase